MPGSIHYTSQCLGEPATAIVLDGKSRNTRETAINSVALLEKKGCGKPLLVTSAAHMSRSVAAFGKVGVDIFPVPTDIRVINNTGFMLLDFLPDADALKMTTDATREWIGQRVYEFQDWN